MFDFDEADNYYQAKAKIIGVGNFGAKMANYSIDDKIMGVDFAVVGAKNETPLRKNLAELVKDLDLLFIFTDLADENISMQIAELAETFLKIAILPSADVDKEKIEKFQGLIDSWIVVDEKNVELMLSTVRCINGLFNPGMVGLDAADIKYVLENSGRGYVGYGKSKGEHPIIDAMNSAINSLKDNLRNSKRMLICFFGWDENLSMLEVNDATTILQDATNPDAEIIWQVQTDIANQDFVEVIIISAE